MKKILGGKYVRLHFGPFIYIYIQSYRKWIWEMNMENEFPFSL